MRDRPAGALNFWRNSWFGPGLAAVALLFAPMEIHGPINLQDEGVWLALIQALLEGKALYTQAWTTYGPLIPYGLASWTAVFGQTLGALRGAVAILNLAGLAAVVFTIYRFLPQAFTVRTVLCFLAAFATYGAHSLTIPFAARYGLAFLPFAVLTHVPSTKNAALAGAVGGAAFLASPEFGVAAALGLAAVLASDARRRHLVWAAAGFAAVVGAAALVLAWRAGFGGFWRSTVAYAFGALVQRSARYAGAARFFAFDHGALPAALFSAAGLLVLSLRSRAPDAALARGTAVFALASCLPAVFYTDRFHVFLGWSPTLLVWAMLARLLPADRRRTAALAAAGAIGALLVVPGFLRWRWNLSVRRPSLMTLHAPRGGAARLSRAQAFAYDLIVLEVQRRTQSEDSILVYPYGGGVYFLADRANAVRYPALTDVARPSQIAEVMADLVERPPRLVVWDAQNTHYQGRAVDELLGPIPVWIKAHYREYHREGSLRFLERAE